MRRMVVLIVLMCSFFIHAKETKEKFPDRYKKLWDFIKSEQCHREECGRDKGLWKSTILRRQTGEEVASDYNIFTGLQMILLLMDLDMYYELEDFSKMNDRFLDVLSKFYNDSEKSKPPRDFGSIAFWPYIKTETGRWAHTFSPHLRDTLFTLNVDIPNDTDDSAHGAIYLVRRQYGQNRVSTFANIRYYLEPKKGAYWTWIKSEAAENNTVDCVVNINVLNAMQWISLYHPNLVKETDLIKPVQYIRSWLHKGDLVSCSEYYSRPSQFLFAFAKLHKQGRKTLFSKEDVARAKELVLAQLTRKNKMYSLIELSELLASYKILHKKTLHEESVEVEARIEQHQRDLLNRLDSFETEMKNYKKIGSVFTGSFYESYDWYSVPQTLVTALYAVLY